MPLELAVSPALRGTAARIPFLSSGQVLGVVLANASSFQSTGEGGFQSLSVPRPG